MIDKYDHVTAPIARWRRIDKFPPPKNVKLLFKTKYGPLVTGIWYPESEWVFWSFLPKLEPEDKEWLKTQG